jgi:ring-1,2-phenylacetyl-CoA epoxidase subunit PaaD
VSPVLTAAAAREVAGAVVDPELPMLTLADLGILREVAVDRAGAIQVSLTPTYLGCPALEAMRAAVDAALRAAGAERVSVRTVLRPAWTTDDITPAGRAKLQAAGVAPPGPAGAGGPVPVRLAAPSGVPCPRCGAAQTEQVSRFGPTACTALRRCPACGEPFEAVKPR